MTSDLAPTSEPKRDAEKPIVLVVDDSRLMRHAIKKILAADFTLLEGVDGEDGWEKLISEPGIQVVFTDLSMPGLDGFGLLQRIRGSSESRISELPVIVITGNEDDETIKERALKTGATDFITKPFQSVQIRARADAHAKNQRKLQEVTSALEEQSIVDTVTQLANVRHFMQRGNENLSFAVRHKSELAIILLELDDFAALSVGMTQITRDEILAGVADVLRAQTRREDTLARLDVARFGVLLPASNSVGTRHLGKRMLAEIEQLKFFHEGRRVKISASMGVATPDIKAETTLESILRCAESRLAIALQSGGNCLVKDDQTTVASLQEAVRQVQELEYAQQREVAEAKQRAEAAEKAKVAEELRRRADEDARIAAAAEAQARAEAEVQAAQAERLRAEEAARIIAEAEALQRAEAQAQAAEAQRLREAEEARIRIETEARQRAEAQAQVEAAEAERVRVEEEARVKLETEARLRAEVEAQTARIEEERQAAIAAARVKDELEAQQRAEMEAIAAAATEARLRAQAQEVEKLQRNADEAARYAATAAARELEIVAEPTSSSDETASDTATAARHEIDAAKLRADHETAQLRAESATRRRAVQDEENANTHEMARRRSEVEAELARVESAANTARGKAIPAASDGDAVPLRFARPIGLILRGILPLVESVNRRFKLNWDDKLAALRKRI